MAHNFDMQKWVDITIEHWKRNIANKKIGKSGELLKSIQGMVKSGGGQGILSGSKADDILWARFMMLRYARFNDMGVARTIRYNSTRAEINRGQRAWYSKQLYKEVKILHYILAKQLGHEVLSEMTSSFGKFNGRLDLLNDLINENYAKNLERTIIKNIS